MPRFCVNTNAQYGSNDHEVHDTTIERWCLPDPSNRRDLGIHQDCRSAVAQAKRAHYSDSNGCKHCAPACHTT